MSIVILIKARENGAGKVVEYFLLESKFDFHCSHRLRLTLCESHTADGQHFKLNYKCGQAESSVLMAAPLNTLSFERRVLNVGGHASTAG